MRKFFWLVVVIVSCVGAIIFNRLKKRKEVEIDFASRILLIEFFASTVLVTVRLGSLDLVLIIINTVIVIIINIVIVINDIRRSLFQSGCAAI